MKRRFIPLIFSFSTLFVLNLLSGSFNLNAQSPQQSGTSSTEMPVFTVVENMPEYPGGDDARLKFLADNIQYPKEAKETGISGTVYVTFVIDTKGLLTDARIMRGIGGGCDEEVLRILALMPPWKPGTQEGKPVRVQFTMPVKFTLDGGGSFMGENGENRLQTFFYWGFSGVDFESPAAVQPESVLRVTAFPNIEIRYNIIQRKNFLLYSGVSIANMGISLKDSVKHTYRYLGVGVPLAIQIRDKENHFQFELGGGIDIPFHYKEKHYQKDDKEKKSTFYSKQINPFQPWVFATIGFSFVQIRFKYFTGDFFNQEYRTEVNGVEFYPFKGTRSVPYEISLIIGD